MFNTEDIRGQARSMHRLADDLHDDARRVGLTDLDTWKGTAATQYRLWLGSISSSLKLAALGVEGLEGDLLDHARSVDAAKEAIGLGGPGRVLDEVAKSAFSQVGRLAP